MQSDAHKADRQLDRTLEQTFPASDPVPQKKITGTESLGSDINRRTPRKVSSEEVEAAAQHTVDCPECKGLGKVVPAED